MQNNFFRSKIFISIACLIYSFFVFTDKVSGENTNNLDKFKTFEDWCKAKDQLSEDLRHTVEELLLIARTSDCKIAGKTLPKGKSLRLNNRGISNLLPLASLSNSSITIIHLSENKIVNIQPLEKLTKLTELGISGNRISDISPLRNLTNLTILSAKRNQITDVTPLKGLIELRYLFLRDNKITDISSLQSLRNISVNSGIFTGNPIINKTCPFRKEVICRF